MILSVALISALIPHMPIVAPISIVLIILLVGALYPKGIYATALLNLLSLYAGLSFHGDFSRPPFGTFSVSQSLTAFPFLFAAIFSILLIGSFFRTLFVLPEE